jgi:hypothetical protein
MNARPIAIGPVLAHAMADTLHHYFSSGDELPLVLYLRTLMPIPFSGLALYGSLAQRSIPAEIGHSDVDLLVLTDEPAHGGIFGFAREVQVDLHVQMRAETLADLERNGLYGDARILWDARPPELQNWLAKLKIWRNANRPEWSTLERLRNEVWAERLIQRLEMTAPVDEGKAWLLSSRLIASIPSFYTQVRGLHSTSFSQWWRTLPASHPMLHERVNRYLCDRQIDPPVLREIFALVFQSVEPGLAVRATTVT